MWLKKSAMCLLALSLACCSVSAFPGRVTSSQEEGPTATVAAGLLEEEQPSRGSGTTSSDASTMPATSSPAASEAVAKAAEGDRLSAAEASALYDELVAISADVAALRQSSAEKDEEMRRFAQCETQIMVATTVIEVGVNVPNASVMVIENAERFGLSQLHQLRGRVGRGADQSYCILMTGYKLSEETRKRIQIMVDTNDGFEIAEADLKLRGPGDIEGTQQSGVAFDLKIANLARDGQLLQYVREVAEHIIDDDPQAAKPEYAVVWRHLAEIRKRSVDWSAIS